MHSLVEQMRLRRERVAQWRAQKAGGAATADGTTAPADGAAPPADGGGDMMEEDTQTAKLADAALHKAEESYFDKESDDEEEPAKKAAPEAAVSKEEKNEKAGQAETTAADVMEEEDDDVDPLDAYMKDVTKEVTQLEKEDKKRYYSLLKCSFVLTYLNVGTKISDAPQ